MKFKRGKGAYKVPAHRDYYLTLIRPSGERLPMYFPYVFTTEAKAQHDANLRNACYPKNYGRFIVEFKDYPESIGYDLGRIIF